MRRIVFALALLAAACGGSDGESLPEDHDPVALNAASGPEDGKRVVVIGDSITRMAQGELEDELADTRLSITAVPGYLLRDFDLDRLDALDPEVVVIALGTNNLIFGGWEDADEDELDDLLADVGSPPCTLLVDVAGNEPITGSDGETLEHFDEDAAQLNRLLDDRARARTDAGDPTVVVPWSSIAHEPGVLDDSGVHPTADGIPLWVDLVASAIRDGC